jgi:uncharacterized protein YndB with AHSA1/START domain
MTMPHPPAPGRATTVKKLFSRQTSVAIDIAAPATTIWKLLTNADGYKLWNTTIVELNGKIVKGEKILLRSTIAPERTFKLRVKEFDPPTRLSWGDAMGTRTFTLTPSSNGGTRFQMTEVIGGPIFPLFARLIPSFDESFDKFAADLKFAAEEHK